VFVMFAFHLFASFGPSPQQAALNALYQPNGNIAIVERMNLVGRYAAVLTRGGQMEGSTVTWPILVEHFSFGWQALDALNFRCRLDEHGISSGDKTQLMRGMPQPQDDWPCIGVGKDAGPVPDVEAIRRTMRFPLIPYVVVVGTYAIGQWYGGGGGETLFRKGCGTWRRIAGGGGAMGISEMRQYGVPRSAWCAFGIYDAVCPHKN
jgi:hypothetical protein